MTTRRHLPGRLACPHLPAVERVLTAETTRRFGGDYGPGFYLAALRYAQSLWQEGKAAQALLQLNKALMAKLDGTESVLHRWPLPYAAKRWVIENCPEDEFLGNPVRHYQHLASRMSGPRPELRTWRAWGCFYLAESLLPAAQYPRDEEQIRKEALAIPSCGYVLEQVEALGLPGEAALLRTVMGA